ncbi:hypothetical protein P175DRAFT_0426382 [Aspergillus ochraceoroseus IBT 24754]|uniref:DNA (cytosine-5)-methyltransferase 1 replication foci domain-containing protein n=3 Tax=Aspergillus subgen. Nidulantes TaxID=2720870 RepID=A0A2T5MAD2_9EURO|nr:uncharacterized protein P175DRAFT_0426382 [Aspergillus ochraceoroseus IBT 24754]KKK19328.1 hypothetical protein AOCH_006636 [Aspergillus ochraceoroseus]PTU25509.1 hypothetical protein P175DRAFT_0426382 [Aspergillus ochraceoroseus IBT 24754]
MTSREDSVLAPRDPSLTDENDWEEFSLSEVRILLPGKSRYASLLTATPENPVQVTGCLEEVEEEQESLVLDPDYLSKRIVLDNVSHFAYGQHNDGEVGIWVAGRAGWFSISPARGYRPMFNDVIEAIDLLYFLTDRHKPKRRKRKRGNPSVQDLCDEYVHHTYGICEDGDDSAEVFYKHHNFLLSRMLKGEENVEWTETNIFAHLCEKFPEDYEQLRDKHESKDESKSEPEEEIDSDPESEAKAPIPDPTTISNTQADEVYQVILDLKEAGHLAKRQLNLELVASTLVNRFEVDSMEYAKDLISSRAAAVIEHMDEAKTNSFDWSKKVIYRELKASLKKNKLENLALTPLRPRITENDASSGEESEHEEQPGPRNHRVRKSVLRPKSSVATKRTGKRTRSTAADFDALSDGNQDAMDEFETPSKVRGHDLVRDPLSTRAKRRTRSILSDPDSTTPIVQKTPLQETLQSRNTSVSAVESETNHSLPDLDDSHDDNFPSDTWICQVPGCGKTIPKCTSKRGKEMVQDHSLAHADDTKAKLDLVIAEQRLNVNIRVDNLLSRIRDMGSLDAAFASLNGGTNGASNGIGT